MKYRMNIVIENEITDYKVAFSLNCNFFYNEKEYGNGYYAIIDGKNFGERVFDLRYNKNFDENNKEKWIEKWINSQCCGKYVAYSVRSVEMIKLYTWDDVYDRADGKRYGDDELTAKDNARWNVRNLAINNGYPDLEETECPEDMVEFYCEEFDILFNEDGNIVEHSLDIEKE
jgi:hypothetical protein